MIFKEADATGEYKNILGGFKSFAKINMDDKLHIVYLQVRDILEEKGWKASYTRGDDSLYASKKTKSGKRTLVVYALTPDGAISIKRDNEAVPTIEFASTGEFDSWLDKQMDQVVGGGGEVPPAPAQAPEETPPPTTA